MHPDVCGCCHAPGSRALLDPWLGLGLLAAASLVAGDISAAPTIRADPASMRSAGSRRLAGQLAQPVEISGVEIDHHTAVAGVAGLGQHSRRRGDRGGAYSRAGAARHRRWDRAVRFGGHRRQATRPPGTLPNACERTGRCRAPDGSQRPSPPRWPGSSSAKCQTLQRSVMQGRDCLGAVQISRPKPGERRYGGGRSGMLRSGCERVFVAVWSS